MIRAHDGSSLSSGEVAVDESACLNDDKSERSIAGIDSPTGEKDAPAATDGAPSSKTSWDASREKKLGHRYRVRFQKLDLLRFVSHNDLLRAWERLLRRTGLPLKFTEGFHAKPVISSPLSLALGVMGEDEIIDFEITEDFESSAVDRMLKEESIEGLSIVSTSKLLGRRLTSAVRAVEYRCVPCARMNESDATTRAEEFFAGKSWVVERHAFGKPSRQVDLRPFVETIVVEESQVRFRLHVENGQTARPAEVLAMLGFGESTSDGSWAICRTRVELVQDERDMR